MRNGLALFAHLLLQILVNNLDEFFSGQGLRSLPPCAWINHMFANMVFDHLGDESVQGAAAGSCLLEHIGALVIRLDGSFDRLDLTAQPPDAIQQFGFFRRDVTHDSKLPLNYYTQVGYINPALFHPPEIVQGMDPQPSTPTIDASTRRAMRLCCPLFG